MLLCCSTLLPLVTHVIQMVPCLWRQLAILMLPCIWLICHICLSFTSNILVLCPLWFGWLRWNCTGINERRSWRVVQDVVFNSQITYVSRQGLGWIYTQLLTRKSFCAVCALIMWGNVPQFVRYTWLTSGLSWDKNVHTSNSVQSNCNPINLYPKHWCNLSSSIYYQLLLRISDRCSEELFTTWCNTGLWYPISWNLLKLLI